MEHSKPSSTKPVSRRIALAGLLPMVGAAWKMKSALIAVGANPVRLLSVDSNGDAIEAEPVGYVVGARQDCARLLNASKAPANSQHDRSVYVTAEWIDEIIFVPFAESPKDDTALRSMHHEAKTEFAARSTNTAVRGCGFVSAKVDLTQASKQNGRWIAFEYPHALRVFSIVPDGHRNEEGMWEPDNIWISTEPWNNKSRKIADAIKLAKDNRPNNPPCQSI